MMEAEDYTFAEMADIHFFYDRANGNAHEARRLYRETFPNRRFPCSRTSSRIAQRLRERGTFIPVNEGERPRTARTIQQEQRILAHVAANPGTSTHTISSAESVHHSTVWRILHLVQLKFTGCKAGGFASPCKILPVVFGTMRPAPTVFVAAIVHR